MAGRVWQPIPPGPDRAYERMAVRTGEEIVSWGGTTTSYDGHVDTGAAYTPPAVP